MSRTPELEGFRTVHRLGEGGMGEVWLVERSEGRFLRRYALKRLRPALANDPRVRRGFLEEGRLAGSLSHPNVVRVYDLVELPSGPVLLMDYVDGLSVGELLRRGQEEFWDVPPSIALEWMRDVSLALRAAHEHVGPDGEPAVVVHRDLSPENVLVGWDGVARLADFGIAKALDAAAPESTRDILEGKLGYMAPELHRFADPTPASDLFALGVVLYELLAGHRLYRDDAAARILNEPPPDLLDARADAPPSVVALLFRLLAKDPGARPKSAEVPSELERALAIADREGAGFDERVLGRDFMETLRRRPDADTLAAGEETLVSATAS